MEGVHEGAWRGLGWDPRHEQCAGDGGGVVVATSVVRPRLAMGKLGQQSGSAFTLNAKHNQPGLANQPS
jgi:hypothetical protein